MSNSENGKNSFLKVVKENPAKIFLWVYPYVLVIGLGIGLFYIGKLNTIERKTIPPPLPEQQAVPTDLKLEMPSTVPKADVSALAQPSDSMVALGKKLFSTTCVSCHGDDGKGDGMAAKGLNPSPRNFTSKEGWINSPKLSGIYQTLSEGINGSAMVAFSNFSPKEKFALAQYIRSNFVPDPPKDTKEDLQDLEDTYHLSEGQKNSGQIPIEDAMVLVEQDAQPRYQKINNVIKVIDGDAAKTNLEGAKIFEKVTKDKVRALTVLSGTDEWHNNEKKFIDLVVNELSENGFNDNVHDLSSSEWNSLYDYMGKFF